jgi:hypothetical protein
MSEEAKTWTITLTRKCEYEVEARNKMQAIAKSYHEFDEMPSECWYQSIQAEVKEEDTDD